MFVDQRHDTVRILENFIQKLEVVLAEALSLLIFSLRAITFGSRCSVNLFTSAIMTPIFSAASVIVSSGVNSARILPIKSSQHASHQQSRLAYESRMLTCHRAFCITFPVFVERMSCQHRYANWARLEFSVTINFDASTLVSVINVKLETSEFEALVREVVRHP